MSQSERETDKKGNLLLVCADLVVEDVEQSIDVVLGVQSRLLERSQRLLRVPRCRGKWLLGHIIAWPAGCVQFG